VIGGVICNVDYYQVFWSVVQIIDFHPKTPEVKLEFLVMGHTHEDIDYCFEYFSKTLKEQNNYILVNLMKVFMVSQELPFIS
jgi:hypothetical protein